MSVEHKGSVWMGGDSAASDGSSIHTRAEPKVWIDGPFAFGWCDSFRYAAMLRYAFKPPKPPKTGIDKYFTLKFIPALRECFKVDLDDLPNDHGRYPQIDFLIALHGKLYVFERDWQIGRCRDGFAAVGSGFDVAMGALYASRNMTPRNRILTALMAAERYTTLVRAPFTVLQVGA